MTPYLNLLACSGPNVQEGIRATIVYSKANAAFACIVTVVIALGVRALKFASLPLPLASASLVLHPAWWVDPWKGDCGGALFVGSTIVSMGFGGLLAWHLASVRRARAQEPVTNTSLPGSPYPRSRMAGSRPLPPGEVPLWMTVTGFMIACLVFMGAMDSDFFSVSDNPFLPLVVSGIPTLLAGRAYLSLALTMISTVLAFITVRGWVEGWTDGVPSILLVATFTVALLAFFANRWRMAR